MKILIVGAGLQGSVCASILARDDFADEILLADYDYSLVEKVMAKLDSKKIKGFQVDATKVDDVAALADGCDIIMDFVMPWMATYVMKAALKVNAHYVNTAYDAPYWDQLTQGKELELNREFEAAGLTAILGCGSMPGYLNVCIAKYANKLDSVENIFMRNGFGILIPVPRLGEWDPGWSPKQALTDFLTEPTIFENGEYKKVPIFSGEEDFVFEGPIGEEYIAYHSHEEAYSLPYSYRDKGIKNCSFRYPVDEQAATYIYQGFVPDNEIEVNGVKVKPFDVLMQMVAQPGEAFFEEEAPTEEESIACCETHVDIEGTENGKKVSYRINVPFLPKNQIKTYEVCGTNSVGISLPAVTGAKMCAEGTKKGVIFAEQMDPDRFLEIINEKLDFMPSEIYKK